MIRLFLIALLLFLTPSLAQTDTSVSAEARPLAQLAMEEYNKQVETFYKPICEKAGGAWKFSARKDSCTGLEIPSYPEELTGISPEKSCEASGGEWHEELTYSNPCYFGGNRARPGYPVSRCVCPENQCLRRVGRRGFSKNLLEAQPRNLRKEDTRTGVACVPAPSWEFQYKKMGSPKGPNLGKVLTMQSKGLWKGKVFWQPPRADVTFGVFSSRREEAIKIECQVYNGVRDAFHTCYSEARDRALKEKEDAREKKLRLEMLAQAKLCKATGGTWKELHDQPVTTYCRDLNKITPRITGRGIDSQCLCPFKRQNDDQQFCFESKERGCLEFDSYEKWQAFDLKTYGK